MSSVVTNLHTLGPIYAEAARRADRAGNRHSQLDSVRNGARRRVHDAFLRLAAERGHVIEGSPYQPRNTNKRAKRSPSSTRSIP